MQFHCWGDLFFSVIRGYGYVIRSLLSHRAFDKSVILY